MATEAVSEKLPPLGVIVGVATMSVNETARLKVVVLITLPPPALTVMVKFPAGVAVVVLMFSTVEQAGLQEGDENEAVAPGGNPETLNETVWLVPESNVVERVLVTEVPATID